MKTCNTCKESKVLEEFGKDSNRKDGRKLKCKDCYVQWRKENSAHLREYFRNWVDKNHPRSNAIKAKYANSAHGKAKKKEWEQSNLPKVREIKASWKRRNYHVVNADTAARRAAKDKATPLWADTASIRAFYSAAQFLGMVTGEWYTVDHIVPLRSKKVCGLHCEANLRVIPEQENLRKSNSYWPDMP